jgi:thiol-disulfide isomerase/thioredoxin
MKHLLGVGLALSLGCSHRTPVASTEAPEPGAKMAPAKPTLPPEIDASKLRAWLDQQRGKPVLVNVFASWCTPCRDELPDLERLGDKYRDLVLLGINVDQKPEALLAFLPTGLRHIRTVRHGAGIAPLLPALHLPDDWNAAMPPGWQETLPLTFVFNRKGEFETGSLGRLSAEALAEISRIASAK